MGGSNYSYYDLETNDGKEVEKKYSSENVNYREAAPKTDLDIIKKAKIVFEIQMTDERNFFSSKYFKYDDASPQEVIDKIKRRTKLDRFYCQKFYSYKSAYITTVEAFLEKLKDGFMIVDNDQIINTKFVKYVSVKVEEKDLPV